MVTDLNEFKRVESYCGSPEMATVLETQLAAVKVQLAKSQDDHLSEEVAFVQVLADLHEVHDRFKDLECLRDDDRALLSQVATRWGLN